MIPGELALLVWPVFAAFLFRQLDLKTAMIWTIVGGYLLLPSAEEVGWDLPLLPPIDKVLIPTLAALALATFMLRKDAAEARLQRGTQAAPAIPMLKGWLPRTFIGRILLIMLVVGAVGTVLTNGDVQVFGPRVSSALRPYDALSALVEIAIYMLPFVVGRKFFYDAESHKLVLVILCIAGALYVLPALYEVRMSPQLNRTVYGFFPHSWVQHIRAGGWRPLVFLDHGLLLGIFLTCSIVACCILMRIYQGAARFGFVLLLLWLLVGLYLAKTVGALLIAIALIPVALFFGRRLQLWVAAAVALTTILFPMVRGAGLVPTEELVAWFAQYDERRAASLEYRFDNEDILLDRANERPVFGWGGFGRARVFDEQGRDLSTTDGAWVILIGEGGWIGYIAQFGLLTLPIILFAIRQRRYQIDFVTAGLCVMLAANLIDLIPNSSITPILWLVSGMLMGRLEVTKPAQDTAPEPDPAGHVPDMVVPEAAAAPTSAYTRFAQNKRRITAGE